MKVTIQFFFLVGMLFVGVLLGINAAENGIYKIDGHPDQENQGFHISRIENGKMEIRVLGNRMVTDKKIEQQDNVNKTPEKFTNENRLGQIGNTLGKWVKQGVHAGLEWMVGSNK